MRFMVIENGIAVNAILAESADAVPGQTLVQSDTASIGDLWDGQTFSAPPVDIPAARARKVAEIKAERDRRCQQGGFPAAGKWFYSDVFSRGQLTGLVIAGHNIPPGLMWKTMDGSFIAMTPTLAGQIFASAATQDAATFQRAEELQVFANNVDSPDGLVLSGWPPIYGD